MKKDKKRIESPEISEQVLALFFQATSFDQTPVDYVIMERAYRGLPIESWPRFLQLAKDRGVDLQARNLQGRTLAEEIASHANNLDFAEAIEQALA